MSENGAALTLTLPFKPEQFGVLVACPPAPSDPRQRCMLVVSPAGLQLLQVAFRSMAILSASTLDEVVLLGTVPLGKWVLRIEEPSVVVDVLVVFAASLESWQVAFQAATFANQMHAPAPRANRVIVPEG